jgi:hypothetical protein
MMTLMLIPEPLQEIEFDPQSLGNRGVLRGVQCVCGQWWPDFVRTDHALQFRTECCGSLYQYQSGPGSLTTLSLVEDATQNRPSADA